MSCSVTFRSEVCWQPSWTCRVGFLCWCGDVWLWVSARWQITNSTYGDDEWWWWVLLRRLWGLCIHTPIVMLVLWFLYQRKIINISDCQVLWVSLVTWLFVIFLITNIILEGKILKLNLCSLENRSRAINKHCFLVDREAVLKEQTLQTVPYCIEVHQPPATFSGGQQAHIHRFMQKLKWYHLL